MLEHNSPIPLYFQLKSCLVENLDSGRWRPGDLIPSEVELQGQYGVSRSTVRQALGELAVEGRLSRRRGRGTFVTDRKLSHAPQRGHTLSDSLRARGLKSAWRVIEYGMHPAPVDVASRLQIEPGTSVFRSSRLRFAGDDTIGHIVAYATVDEQDVDLPALEGEYSLDYLVETGLLGGAIADREIEAIAADHGVARLLGVAVDAPILLIRRLVRTSDGQAFEAFEGRYCGDRFQYLTSGLANVSVRPTAE